MERDGSHNAAQDTPSVTPGPPTRPHLSKLPELVNSTTLGRAVINELKGTLSQSSPQSTQYLLEFMLSYLCKEHSNFAEFSDVSHQQTHLNLFRTN